MLAGSTNSLKIEVKFQHSALALKNPFSRRATEAGLETTSSAKQDQRDQVSFQKQLLKDKENTH